MVYHGLEHFLRLAQRGAYPAASGSAGRAHALALAMVELIPGLDEDALGGLLEFACITHTQAETARMLLQGHVTFVTENPAPPDYIIPVILDRDDLAQHVFDHVWHALEQLSMVDTVGGMEYKRVVGEWKEAGRPDEMGSFILEHTRADYGMTELDRDLN